MRDHRQLRVFQDAHQLVKAVYVLTRAFPKEEQFGLTSQVRRSASSVPFNIVEGSGRASTKEYLRFLEIAYSSCQELCYQLLLVREMEVALVPPEVEQLSDVVSKQLAKLIQSLG